jgi:hypothetical protein
MSVEDENTSFLSKNVIRKDCPKNSFKYVPTFGAPTRNLFVILSLLTGVQCILNKLKLSQVEIQSLLSNFVSFLFSNKKRNLVVSLAFLPHSRNKTTIKIREHHI